MSGEGKAVKVCPRCGGKYSYIERRQKGDQVYLYAVHKWKEEGRTRVKKCYLGPESGYIYVSHLHQDLGLNLFGLMTKERALYYIQALTRYYQSKGHYRLTKEELQALKRLVNVLLVVTGERRV